MIFDITKLLSPNPYPGRGIIIGLSEDGKNSVAVYFIMGRSENSRNRIFVETNDGIRINAFNAMAMTDQDLVIYHPVREVKGRTVVTNGDQTDTIRDFLLSDKTFRGALMTREFEPDVPNYTPRISGIIEPDGSYQLSILKSFGGNPSYYLRQFFDYSPAIAGTGHFISTYLTDGDPLPSFSGEPIPVKIDLSNGFQEFAKSIWNALNEENKVSLYVRETEIATGKTRKIIINKHGGLVE